MSMRDSENATGKVEATVPLYVQNLLQQLASAVMYASPGELAAVRQHLLDTAKATIDIEIMGYVRGAKSDDL